MDRWRLRFPRQPVSFGLAQNQKESVKAAHRRFNGIVKLSIGVTGLLQLVEAFLCARAQLVQRAEQDRFSRAHLRACGNEAALLPIVAERAFESAAGIGQRFGSAIDYAKRAGDDAVSAAVTDIVLHQHGADLCAHDRAGGARFEAAGLFAMFANIRKENPPEWILSVV